MIWRQPAYLLQICRSVEDWKRICWFRTGSLMWKEHGCQIEKNAKLVFSNENYIAFCNVT